MEERAFAPPMDRGGALLWKKITCQETMVMPRRTPLRKALSKKPISIVRPFHGSRAGDRPTQEYETKERDEQCGQQLNAVNHPLHGLRA